MRHSIFAKMSPLPSSLSPIWRAALFTALNCNAIPSNWPIRAPATASPYRPKRTLNALVCSFFSAYGLTFCSQGKSRLNYSLEDPQNLSVEVLHTSHEKNFHIFSHLIGLLSFPALSRNSREQALHTSKLGDISSTTVYSLCK